MMKGRRGSFPPMDTDEHRFKGFYHEGHEGEKWTRKGISDALVFV
jgi:hypothetical protein